MVLDMSSGLTCNQMGVLLVNHSVNTQQYIKRQISVRLRDRHVLFTLIGSLEPIVIFSGSLISIISK
jgi:hypothetical protein